MTDDELERRRRAALAQTRRMFENLDKEYEEHTEIDSPVDDIDEDELEAELAELQADAEIS